MYPTLIRSFRFLGLIWLAGLTLSPRLYSAEMSYGEKGKIIKAASIDVSGDVHLNYEDGSQQQVTTEGHCEQVKVTDDHQTAGWLLSEKMNVDTPSGREERVLSKLIVYRAGRIICAINPNVRVQTWRFWSDASQAVIKAAPAQGPAFYSLYSIPGAHEIDRVPDTADTQLLPEWAHFAQKSEKTETKETTSNPKSSASSPVTPSRRVQKVAIIALARDKALSADVESGIKDRFVENGVKADSLRTLFVSTVPVSEMIDQLRAGGYDSLLCLAPRKTIRFVIQDTAVKGDRIEDCLNTYITGSYNTGEPLEVTPLSEDRMLPAGSANVSRSPIPSNPGSAPFRVSKGTVRFFDLTSGSQLWQGNAQVKMPAELRTSMQVKLITRSVWQVITKSGLLPPHT